MRPITHPFHLLLTPIVLLLLLTISAHAGDPGLAYPAEAAVSDQKAGSLLVYNIYTSSAANSNVQNARIAITNTDAASDVSVHLFFVDGTTCSVADASICLTKNQTAAFVASDIDPGITGYLVAVAVDALGCPVRHNFLIGDLYVKFATGHAGNLGAEAFAAQFTTFTGCTPSSVTATLFFDQPGVPDSYNLLPRVLAVDNIPDRTSGNSMLLIVNRIGGNLATGAATLGALFGIIYDDGENGFSFSFTPGVCQFRSVLSNNFPRTAPRFEQLIPAGRSGWMRLWAENALVGLLGATINYNPNANAAANAFNGAHNLHKLTLNASNSGTAGAPSITIPIVPSGCD